jgi:hypothetical protein
MPIAWQLYRDIENPEMFVYTNDSTENMTDETRDPRFGHDGRRLRSKLQPFEPEHREDLPTSYVSTQPWSCNNSCKGLPIGTESSGTPWTPSSGSTFRLGSDQLPGEDLSESPPQTDSDENAPSASIRHGLSLDQLRAVEKHPRHEWSEDERLLLCIMQVYPRS